MPFDDLLQVRLPRAIEIENDDPGEPQRILVRTHTFKIFVNTAGGFRLVVLDKLIYSPAWAKVDCAILRSRLEVMKLSGDKGIIPLGLSVTDFEPVLIEVQNNSIDTAVRLALNGKGWQSGEG